MAVAPPFGPLTEGRAERLGCCSRDGGRRNEAELRDELHRQNAERVRRAAEHRAALTEASIHEKDTRYEQRKATQSEEATLREGFQMARYRQSAAMHSQLRAKADAQFRRGVDTSALGLPLADNTTALVAAAESAPPPSQEVVATSTAPAGAAQSAAGRATRQAPRVAPTSRATAAQGHPAPSGRLSIETGSATAVAAGGVGGGVRGRVGRGAGGNVDAVRDAEKQRAAFAQIENLRYVQNAELRAAVEAEQKAEVRARLLRVLRACC